jgi:hypothetical protein
MNEKIKETINNLDWMNRRLTGGTGQRVVENKKHELKEQITYLEHLASLDVHVIAERIADESEGEINIIEQILKEELEATDDR